MGSDAAAGDGLQGAAAGSGGVLMNRGRGWWGGLMVLKRFLWGWRHNHRGGGRRGTSHDPGHHFALSEASAWMIGNCHIFVNLD
uniref:Uncharacterized protein n=1 Tax=Candidatus Methanogaster sp. ANME-2c ERB4 TaxID=2759911 RepID=A0A7G9Y127_9EURY|nr:hypothetical protein NEBFCOPL_00012 [Methanosarcinales archaeon ANME-2c ERB4]